MVNNGIAVGLPVYDLNLNKIEITLNNINQTYKNVKFVILCEKRNIEDEKMINLFFEKVYETNMWKDNKIIFAVNLTKFGLAKNWNRTKQICSELEGDYKYFCWFSDHDEYSSTFLNECAHILEKNIDYVSCFPNLMINQKLKRIKIGGNPHGHRNNPNSLGYGQSIYGLHRLDSITDIEFSNNYLPDRLFMQELSTRGRVVEFHMENIIFRKIVEPNSEFSFQSYLNTIFYGIR